MQNFAKPTSGCGRDEQVRLDVAVEDARVALHEHRRAVPRVRADALRDEDALLVREVLHLG